MIKNFAVLLGLLALVACEGTSVDEILDNGQYWQRVNTSESVYLRGGKAQQLLNRDISRCVVELKELERLGALRDTIPTDVDGRVLDPDEVEISHIDSPEREQYLFAEHKDFNDFESCMLAAGWERVKYVPYAVAERAGRTYVAEHVQLREQHKSVKAARNVPRPEFND